MSENKHVVWNNDACSAYDEIEKDIKDGEIEVDDDLSDDQKWDMAYDRINTWFDDEMTNLDKDVKHHLIAMGTVQRWDGGRVGYKNLETNNIAEAIKTTMNSFGGDNTFEVYCDGEELIISQVGHDNPTNPSIMKIRMIKDFDTFEDMLDEHDDSFESLNANTVSIVNDVNEVYGW